MDKKTVLLDLDGTLLPIEIEEFLQGYFKLLTKEFAGIFNPDDFIKHLMAATDQMIKNNGDRLNSEVFMESFFGLMKVENEEEIMAMFDSFYLEKFPLLGTEITTNGLSSRLIKRLRERDYQLILATNPLFPLEAIKERLRWVDINPDDFAFITDYDRMHSCKPNISYYQEIVDKLKLKPNNCIMIGNDVQEDMVAGKLGMKTYLVTDFLIHRNKNEINCDWQGSFAELLACF